MALTLYYHPLASFCQKVLIALYENGTPFVPRFVDLGDAASAAELKQIWPIGKFPVLRDDAKDVAIPESSIIIEYLALHYPGGTPLVPADQELAWQTRLRDRFYDLHVHEPMQKIVGDKLRPPGQNDPHGVAAARKQLTTAYGMIDREMAAQTWAMGDAFTLADCAAAPPLFYANKVMPFGDAHRNVAAYFDRLMQRPSFARVVKEAQPYMHLFPG
ncbi:MAG TPA: glutathione S-transferase family protein [Xanthobacteraceae bacterium]|nr:glutathione S-transferase family protein [Xanthobacteraceae bacterium]